MKRIKIVEDLGYTLPLVDEEKDLSTDNEVNPEEVGEHE